MAGAASRCVIAGAIAREPEQSFQLKDRCAILNALCNNQEIAIADPATTSSALLALHGVAHALARRPWVALERLAGAGRSPAHAFLATLP